MADNDLNYDTISEILGKKKEEEKKSGERRSRNRRDWVTMMPSILSLIAMLLVFAVWIILDRVSPPKYYSWFAFFNSNYRPSDNAFWPRRPVNISYIMLLVSVGLCVIAVPINKLRMRRKGDKFRVVIFSAGIIALITLVIFLIQFIPTGIIGRW